MTVSILMKRLAEFVEIYSGSTEAKVYNTTTGREYSIKKASEVNTYGEITFGIEIEEMDGSDCNEHLD